MSERPKKAIANITEVRDALVIYALIAGSNPTAADRLNKMVEMLTLALAELEATTGVATIVPSP